MEHVYKIPDHDKREEASIKSSNRALIKIMGLNQTDLPVENLSEFLTEKWWVYKEENDLDEDDAYENLVKVQEGEGATIPYCEPYATRFADVIQELPLQEVEHHISVVSDWQGLLADPADVRYLWQCLQERVNSLTVGGSPDDVYLKLPRLTTGITWLQNYEKRLAASLEIQEKSLTPFVWEASKAEFAELGYALLESGVVKAANRAEAVKRMGEIFGVALGDNAASHLQTIQKRKNGGELTPLIERLKAAFISYLGRKDSTDSHKRKQSRSHE